MFTSCNLEIHVTTNTDQLGYRMMLVNLVTLVNKLVKQTNLLTSNMKVSTSSRMSISESTLPLSEA